MCDGDGHGRVLGQLTLDGEEWPSQGGSFLFEESLF